MLGRFPRSPSRTSSSYLVSDDLRTSGFLAVEFLGFRHPSVMCDGICADEHGFPFSGQVFATWTGLPASPGGCVVSCSRQTRPD